MAGTILVRAGLARNSRSVAEVIHHRPSTELLRAAAIPISRPQASEPAPRELVGRLRRKRRLRTERLKKSDLTPELDPSLSRYPTIFLQSAEVGATKSDSKSSVYENRTKTAKCGGLETNGARERISGLGVAFSHLSLRRHASG